MSVYFLTGATGVVGSAIASVLLARPENRLAVLLRGDSDAEVQDRLRALGAFWKLPEADLQNRVEALRGDTSLPRFGLASERFERLAARCSRIVHCAALVRMNLPFAEARASAVGAAETVLELARATARTAGLEKVEFLSTVGIGGDRPGLLPEAWINEPRGYHNTYEQAKAEAEVVVARGVAEGLPITVHRPSMVVGDSRSGEVIRFQIFYHLVEFLSGRRTFGLFPAFGGTKLDIVPVDYVAQAVAWSSGRRETSGCVLHLCTGPEESLSLDALQARVRAAFVAAGLNVPRRVSLPPAMLRAALPAIRVMLPASGRRALSTLPVFLAYLAAGQGFANAETRKILGEGGITLPTVESYLNKVLQRYLARQSPEAVAS
jgi:thioester reductase-like protein